MTGERPTAWHLGALAGLSGGMLAFEILLLRLFEFSHWHHFAGLAIALALLGLGAAGTTLAWAGEWAVRWADRWFLGGLFTLALGLLLMLGVQSQIALRPLFAAWDLGELGQLLLVDLVAFLPFYGAGLAIGQVFLRWPRHTRRLYAANLLGSGAGCVAASVLLLLVRVETALVLIALMVLMLGVLLAVSRRLYLSAGMGLLALLSCLPLAWSPPAPAVSDFKPLARILTLPDHRVLSQEPGLRGLLTLVASDSLRYAPGLSLTWPHPVPTTDVAIVGSATEIPLVRAFPADRRHGQASLAGLPFRLRPEGDVLVLGASAWQSPALATPRHRVTWLEADERLLALARERGARPPQFRLEVDTPWRHLYRDPQRYQLILFDQVYAGGDAAAEDYVLTTRGLALAWTRLAGEGLLALPLPVLEPPRHWPRLLSTVKEALEQEGVPEPGEHIAALRGLQSHLLLVYREPLAAADRAALRDFARTWQFDLDWLPGIREGEVNRYHQTASPEFYQSARAILTGQGELPEGARRFVTGPAELNRPYLWRSMRWRQVPELLQTLGPRGMAYLDWSLIFSVASVAAVTLLAFLLILAPLGRLPEIRPPFSRLGVALYFAGIGLGYMLVEIAVFQRTLLLTDQPVLAATVVFGIFLLGSGVGSSMAPEGRSRRALGRVFGPVLAGFALLGGVLWLAAEVFLQPTLGVRLASVVVLILPLAWAMGRPFPWALRQLADQSRWIPWAWGINGFASVAAAALAPLISVHWGQTVTLGAGLLCYLLAVSVALGWVRR